MQKKTERKSVQPGVAAKADKSKAAAPASTVQKSVAEQSGLLDVLQSFTVAESPPVVVPRPKSVDAMNHDQLKEYAAEIGIQQRDIDGLSEERLRQNCKVRIFTSMEDDE